MILILIATIPTFLIIFNLILILILPIINLFIRHHIVSVVITLILIVFYFNHHFLLELFLLLVLLLPLPLHLLFRELGLFTAPTTANLRQAPSGCPPRHRAGIKRRRYTSG